MAEMLRLKARDGHELDAYLARPKGRVRGGLVVGQEMYGVNAYLRAVCDFYASHGYLAVAPALYDRQQRGLIFAYDEAGHAQAQRTYTTWDFAAALDDLDAGRAAVADAGKVGFVGFCWGGTLAWLAACRKSYDGAVAYYGSWMPDFANEQARCPVIAHIGDRDRTLPPEKIERFRMAQPSVPIFMYPGAQHGFDNADRAPRYDAAAHALARERTLEFLAEHIG
jgi:carboxymethylenebutenolidase